ncbi:hypothetical protein SASPL_132009 [Salvia splendens]|uniref:RING-type domain-containing protein n=1 Tax=Salvia splendens TaxID=180675 RepID=A0A8X8X8G7_SALSN|nr:hypothetical protein SASPL_132009 [Salvia splendens]
MTTASELFYQRRTRIGRNSDSYGVGSDLSSPPPPPSINRRHRHDNSAGGNHSRRDRLDPDGCNPLRRSVHHPRQTSLNRSSHLPRVIFVVMIAIYVTISAEFVEYVADASPYPNVFLHANLYADEILAVHPRVECETVRREEGSHQSSPGNVIHPDPQVTQDWLMLSRNDRLPGAVLLARERLLQRLRGVMLSDSRRSHRNSAGSQRRGFAIGDDFRLVDAGDWETDISREWLAAASPLTNSDGQRLNMRPPGLTQEALSCLPVEVFCVAQESDEQHVPRASRECSICLESFLGGDQLICLPCGHRYHFSCLDPWVRTCADCPYCRRSIDVTTSDRVKKDPEF